MSSVPVSVIGKTDDLRIRGVRALIAPQLLSEQLPVDAEALATVGNARRAIHRVLHGATTGCWRWWARARSTTTTRRSTTPWPAWRAASRRHAKPTCSS